MNKYLMKKNMYTRDDEKENGVISFKKIKQGVTKTNPLNPPFPISIPPKQYTCHTKYRRHTAGSRRNEGREQRDVIINDLIIS